MSSNISIKISKDIIHASKMTPDDLVKELAVSLFQQGKLSFGKAREMTGMSVWEFQQLLASKKITLHYDIKDYQEDMEILKDFGRI
jgi:predicted HTH domain antitoxin